MPTLQPAQVKEVNALIEKIEKSIKPKHEVGSQSKLVLNGVLASHKIKKTPLYFKCKREYADAIVSYFVNEKKMTKNKFHRDGQEFIFLILP